jgi:hypothetical protein
MPFAQISSVLLPRPRTPFALAQRWSTSSQTRARRNAMVALTSLAQRRMEREDADAFLEAASRRSAEAALPAPRRSAEGS